MAGAPDENLTGQNLIHRQRFAGGLNQPVGLEQYVVVFRLRLQEEADRDKSRTEQQPNHHHATVCLLVSIMKRMGHGNTQHRN